MQVKPCIYLKMNNILGWKPEPVKCGDPDAIAEDGLPYDDCPFTLRKVFAIDHFIFWHLMTNLTQHLASVAAKEAGDQNIWIDCSGRFLITANNLVELLQSVAFFRNADDKEALEGRVSYSPASRAIPLTYFPYLVNMKREANKPGKYEKGCQK